MRAEIADFDTDAAIEFRLSGASILSGSINSGDLKVDLSGASRLSLTGRGGDLDADLSGASSIELDEFPLHDANIDLSGASSAKVNLDGRLDAKASGASSVRYQGEPTMGNLSISGASSVGREN